MQISTKINENNYNWNIPMLRVRLDKNTVMTIKNAEEFYHYRRKFPRMKILAR